MSNTPDGAHIVPASCVSMVTAGVCASSKVWRNLPDNPEGQHTELQLTALLCTHTLNPLRVCVCIRVCEGEGLCQDAFPLIYGHGWPPLE